MRALECLIFLVAVMAVNCEDNDRIITVNEENKFPIVAGNCFKMTNVSFNIVSIDFSMN